MFHLKPKENKNRKKTDFKNSYHMLEVLSDDEKCRLFLEEIRWNGKPVCPHCGSQSQNHYQLKVQGVFKGLYKCRDCRDRFTVMVGTMFESSHIPLRKWFRAISIFSSYKKGISSAQLGKDLGITKKSAWFLLGRIRNSYALREEEYQKISGLVKCDETFVGGKNKNRHRDKKVKYSQGRSYKDKTPVFGLMCNGQVYTQVVPNTRKKTIQPIIKSMVEKGSTIVSDEWSAYRGLEIWYNHKVVIHKIKQYANDGFTTNDLEGFWACIKRGIYGMYHNVSRKHLQRYCDEFSFRYNFRRLTEVERFEVSLLRSNRRTTYKELIGKIN